MSDGAIKCFPFPKFTSILEGKKQGKKDVYYSTCGPFLLIPHMYLSFDHPRAKLMIVSHSAFTDERESSIFPLNSEQEGNETFLRCQTKCRERKPLCNVLASTSSYLFVAAKIKSSELLFDMFFFVTLQRLMIVCSVDCMSSFLMIKKNVPVNCKTTLTTLSMTKALFEMVRGD